MTTPIRSYSELIKLPTFEERFRYLLLGGAIGEETFGYDRFLNQALYRSRRWREDIRPKILIRDDGCDLGIEGHRIPSNALIIIHHINPITLEQVLSGDLSVFDPDNLICTTHRTHNAIHYGQKDFLPELPIERQPFDTCPWKQ